MNTNRHISYEKLPSWTTSLPCKMMPLLFVHFHGSFPTYVVMTVYLTTTKNKKPNSKAKEKIEVVKLLFLLMFLLITFLKIFKRSIIFENIIKKYLEYASLLQHFCLLFFWLLSTMNKNMNIYFYHISETI